MEQHPKLFKMSQNSSPDLPVYTLRDGKLYRTTFHTNGWSEHPDYSLKADGKFYRTQFHKLGAGLVPDYEFGRDRRVYQTQTHPLGSDHLPAYEIRE